MTTACSPRFKPRFEKDGGNLFYLDGRISAAVDIDEISSCLVIREWLSLEPGKGHTVDALSWLRAQFTTFVVNGDGSIDDGIGDIATAYWQHMRKKRLVDVLILDDGTELDAENAGHPPGCLKL